MHNIIGRNGDKRGIERQEIDRKTNTERKRRKGGRGERQVMEVEEGEKNYRKIAQHTCIRIKEWEKIKENRQEDEMKEENKEVENLQKRRKMRENYRIEV